MKSPFIRNIFPGNLQLDPGLGLGLIGFIIILRWYLLTLSMAGNDYGMLAMVPLIMMVVPLLILNHQGWIRIGFGKASKQKWLFYAVILGILFSLIIYYIGNHLFGEAMQHWYTFFVKSISLGIIQENNTLTRILLNAPLPLLLFAIGEEIFYRGLVHQCFQERYGSNIASQIDSATFALTYLIHFLILFHEIPWNVLFVPVLIWTLLMFMASRLFFICKLQSGSILGPVVCHSAMNLIMILLVFNQH
ncbi:MAG: CPBP family intramembrane metalloprotease [Saprospiraceae bacterium]|nr:CPBP family intramembrane metalloprotease [Saprospiraceae bacterium]